MTDAARLREAVTTMREHMRHRTARAFTFDDMRLDAVLTAAEAHLATLPAPVITYEVSGVTATGIRRRCDEVSTRDAAGRLAAMLVEEGCHTILVTEHRE